MDQFEIVARSEYQFHNYFVAREGCCYGQFIYYFSHGFNIALLTPVEYFKRLTDYSVNGKRLNYILSFYSIICDANIITKIGFGAGPLKRESHEGGLNREMYGRPYQLKVGDSWTPKIPYINPRYFLTFQWFKVYIMCPEQPWICDNESTSDSFDKTISWSQSSKLDSELNRSFEPLKIQD